MVVVSKLAGRRSRGIVWVCDIASSSKYFNSNESAEALETFLQRFLFVSIIFVEAAGGRFIKWTGDGFLAWFETPLIRDAGEIAREVYNAAWNLTFYVNVTQLCVEAPVKFKIRHAVTLEHDALVIDLTYSDSSSTDVLGRAVVLAFRLSSIKAQFPNIITQGELLRHIKGASITYFRKLKFSKDEKLKFFKDEKWGTTDIFASGDKTHKQASLKTVLRRTKKVIDKAEGKHPVSAVRLKFTERVLAEMLTGPEWCRDVQTSLSDFSRDGLLGNLKRLVPILEKHKNDAPKTEPSNQSGLGIRTLEHS
jgi:class 3 adenylate cyclase